MIKSRLKTGGWGESWLHMFWKETARERSQIQLPCSVSRTQYAPLPKSSTDLWLDRLLISANYFYRIFLNILLFSDAAQLKFFVIFDPFFNNVIMVEWVYSNARAYNFLRNCSLSSQLTIRFLCFDFRIGLCRGMFRGNDFTFPYLNVT